MQTAFFPLRCVPCASKKLFALLNFRDFLLRFLKKNHRFTPYVLVCGLTYANCITWYKIGRQGFENMWM